MKKLYSLICIATLSLFSINASATIRNVDVNSMSFSPATFTAFVGDTVKWTWVSGFHSIDDLTLPGGAAAFNSSTSSTVGFTYTYKITVAGAYGYQCGVHTTNMLGGFSATSPTGISDIAIDVLTNVYPNPFKEKVTVKYNGIETIEFFNVVGEKIKSVEITSLEGKLEVDLESLPAGIYFYRTFKEGVIFETRKIVKGK